MRSDHVRWGLLLGPNNYGEMGNNTTSNSLIPVAVSGFSEGIVSISASDSSACAVSTSGGAYCWGDNSHGELGDNSTTSSLVPVGVSGLSSGVVSISVGDGGTTCAVTTAGILYCWGDSSFGIFGFESTIGSLLPMAVTGLPTGIASFSLGRTHACAVTTSGAAYCWGVNNEGELGNNAGSPGPIPPSVVSRLSSGVRSISVSDNDSCAVTTLGVVYCWGNNSKGQLGTGNTGNALPTEVSGLPARIDSISAGSTHTCAVTTLGVAYCWGSNALGELGDGTTTDSLRPVAVIGLSAGVASIFASQTRTCAITILASAYCWGYYGEGGLGNNGTTNSRTPVSVATPKPPWTTLSSTKSYSSPEAILSFAKAHGYTCLGPKTLFGNVAGVVADGYGIQCGVSGSGSGHDVIFVASNQKAMTYLLRQMGREAFQIHGPNWIVSGDDSLGLRALQ
jgi:hypothetical protein